MNGVEVSSQGVTVEDAEIVVVEALAASGVVADAQLHLSWTSPAAPPRFEVWRSPAPYFCPGDAGAELVAGDGSAACTISGTDVTCDFVAGLGDPDHNDYYIVRALSGAGEPVGQTFRLGEFAFAIVPGGASL